MEALSKAGSALIVVDTEEGIGEKDHLNLETRHGDLKTKGTGFILL